MSYNANGANFVIDKALEAPTISSAKYIFFGNIAVVAKSANGTGIVSSFILQSDDLDEIDWEWIGSSGSSVQTNFFGKGNTTTYDRSYVSDVASPSEQWHTYTLDWTSSAIKWYIDGILIRTVNYDDAIALNGKNFPQTPMRIKIGNWIGCADEAATTNPATQGTCEWAGGAVNFANAPFTMLVKSVTIQDYSCGSAYNYSDASGSYQSIQTIGSCGSSSSTSSSSSSTVITSSASSSSVSSSTTSPETTSTTTTSHTTTSHTTTSHTWTSHTWTSSTTIAPITTSVQNSARLSATVTNATAPTTTGATGSIIVATTQPFASENGSTTEGAGSTVVPTTLSVFSGTSSTTEGGSPSASTSIPSPPISAASSLELRSYSVFGFHVVALCFGVGYLVI